MGAFAQAPDGTLWAGTGEANPPGGGLTYFGDGIYKSTDDGAHWTNVGLRAERVDRPDRGRPVEPEPRVRRGRGPRRPLGRASAASTAPSDARQDAGSSCSPRRTPTTGAIDVAINPTNPQIVYAALWDHKRTNGTRTYGGVGSGLFRSKDGGDTWERLQNIVDPLPAYDQTQTGLKQDASLGRIGVAIAPSNPNRIYVVSGSPYGPDKGFYYSDDGGDTLPASAAAPTQANGGYQWWFGRIWVDPEDQNHIFNADVSLRRRPTAARPGPAIGGAARRPARHGLGPLDARRQPGHAEPRLPRQRRRHVPLRDAAASTARGSRPPTSRGTRPTTSRSPSRTRSG